MNLYNSIVMLTLILSLTACSGTVPKPTTTGFVLADEWQMALSHREKTLRNKRPTLTWQNGNSVDNCRDYLTGKTQGLKLAPTTDNRITASHYQVCAALALLKPKIRLQPSKQQTQQATTFGNRLAHDLDLHTFPSSLGPRLTQKKHTLASLFPHRISVNGPQAVVDTPNWYRSLTVLAVADVDGDGTADWLVRYVDESAHGTYRQYDTLVIHDPVTSDRLKAELASTLLASMPPSTTENNR